MTARHWHHTGAGGCVLYLGKCTATIHRSAEDRWIWSTFDVGGCGGENDVTKTRSEAMRESFGSLLMQGWVDPQRWQIGRPTRAWPVLPPADKENT